MKYLYSLTFILLFVFFSCNQPASEESGNTESPATIKKQNSTALAQGRFELSLKNVFQKYLELKNAFVKSDTMATRPGAVALILALEHTDTSDLNTKELAVWHTESNTVERGLQTILEEKTIKGQRQAFSDVSDAMTRIFTAYGIKGQSIFKQYCPMAFNNKGASWLSDKDSILNPYFGDEMLECGEINLIIEN